MKKILVLTIFFLSQNIVSNNYLMKCSNFKLDSFSKKVDSLKLFYKNKDWKNFNKYRFLLLKNNGFKKNKKKYVETLEYSGIYFFNLHKFDSAYFYYHKTHKIYETIKDPLNLGKSLLNIAIIKKNIKNYRESEIASFRAIECLKNKKSKKASRYLSSIYNNLGIIYKELKDFDNSIKYYEKSLFLRKKNLLRKIHSLNNIGNVHKEKGDYIKASYYYKEGLNYRETLNNNPKIKAMLLNNYANSLFLSNKTEQLPNLYFKSYKIRDSINDIPGFISSNLNIGDFYLKENKKEKAITFYNKALFLSDSISYSYGQLKSLKKIIRLSVKDEYFLKYFNLKDSLQQIERLAKDKFARVRFETSEKEQALAKNKVQLKQENQQKWLLGIGFLASLLTLGVFGYYYRKNQQQKRLIEDLQKELHHRVKNNLSIINRFVEVLKEEFNQPIFDKKLTELQNRIGSINEVHQQLYNSKDVTNLNMKNYINKLVTNLQNSFPNYHIQTIQNVKENLKLTSTKSFPLGIIINEFLTNSFKYAFDNDNGIVNITMEEDSKHYKLLLSDNGKGLPADFDIKTDANFGLRIIRLLCNQIDATFELKNNNGLELLVQMPKG